MLEHQRSTCNIEHVFYISYSLWQILSNTLLDNTGNSIPDATGMTHKGGKNHDDDIIMRIDKLK